MQHHAAITKLPEQQHRLAGLRRGCADVVPARRGEGEKLRQVADRRAADGERGGRVGNRRRLADHEIAEVRLNRRGLRQRLPVARAFEHRPGLGGDPGAPLGRQAHAAVEGEAGAVEAIAASGEFAVNLGQRGGRRVDIVKTDVRVVHDSTFAHRLLLVLELGGNAVRREESRAAEANPTGRIARSGAQIVDPRQRCRRQPAQFVAHVAATRVHDLPFSSRIATWPVSSEYSAPTTSRRRSSISRSRICEP